MSQKVTKDMIKKVIPIWIKTYPYNHVKNWEYRVGFAFLDEKDRVLWINWDKIELVQEWWEFPMCDTVKWRKEWIRKRRRIIEDLKDAPVYEELNEKGDDFRLLTNK